MGRIYESEKDYEKAFEDEFRHKVIEIAYYDGDRERTTLDGEWTYEELKDCMYSDIREVLHGKKGDNGKGSWMYKNKFRAVKDKELLHEEFIINKICDEYDIIEAYNRAYDKHRNDKPLKFGICYFDELVILEATKILNDNLITK